MNFFHRHFWVVVLICGGIAPPAPALDAQADSPSVAAVGPVVPQLASIEPAPGARVGFLSEVEVRFNLPVTGVDAADLLVGGVPALGVSESEPGHFVFGFAPPAEGLVEFRWAAGHGIVAAEGLGTPFSGGAWTVTLDHAIARRKVVISEFMADNDVALYDDDCDKSDWIEIHNAGESPVDLRGWSLTDDAGDPRKWVFPAYTLEAESFLVVFASQKNKTNLPPRACRTRPNSLAGFHTNFRLSSDGEYLALVAPDGEVISAFAPRYPPQRRDVSYGRVPGSPDDVGYLSRPTPRAANVTGGDGFAPEVRFSRRSGPFLDSFLLTLSCPDRKASIRYTVDGTFPAETNANLRTYQGPIPVFTTTQVRARAYQTGFLPGAPASETYLRLTNSPAQLGSFTSTLPIVVITTLKSATIGGSVNASVHFSLFEPRDGRTTLLSQPTLTTRGGAKTRGSSTGGQPQSNFAIEWWDEFNQDKDLPILGMPEHSEWVLYAPNEFDAALIHNPFTMELSRQMNFAAPKTRFVEVYLNKGGPVRSNDWFGLYVLMEKPGLSKGRIDAPKAQPEDTEFPEVTGSYMFKTDRLDPGDVGFSAGGAGNGYVEPKEREMRSPQRAPQLAYLTKFFRDLDTALRPTNPNLRDPVVGYRAYIDVTNWVDFHMLELLSGQVDAIRLSTYFYKRREGKLEYGPRWDYDRAWESKGDGRDDNPRVWDSGGGLFGTPWWNRVLADSDAWQLWIDRWTQFRGSVLSQSNMFRIMDRMTNEIRTAQPRENRRWNSTAPRLNYPNEIRIMKTWISNRLAWIDSQFAQPPVLSSGSARVDPGFLLTLAPPASISNPGNVAIFYTLDGTDPRPSRGTSAPVAFQYTGPIPITNNSRVVARVRDRGRSQRGGPLASSQWSAPAIATLVVAPIPVVVTELMFHPEGTETDVPGITGDPEFLELKNTSDREIDLAGCEFVHGVSFRFSSTNALRRLGPGGRLLLVQDREAFLARYPNAGPIAGEYSGNLANEGERITLVGPVGETILDFSYADGVLPLAADGLGFSVVLADESTGASDLGDARRWRLSALPGGSPGAPDPTPGLHPPQVVISEVLAASAADAGDWIELFNPEDREADVGGWWLTDSLDDPKRVRIPSGWKVGPKGFLVIPSSVFDGATQNGFAFSSGGDSVWLLSSDPQGNLTGWVHGFRFGASPGGTSLGRLVTTDGRQAFVAQSKPTRGLPNAGPRISPLVLTEIALQSSDSGVALGVRDAFVELMNASGSTVALVDAANPGHSWQVRGDIDLDFADLRPRGWNLDPGQRVVLVGFDPELDRLELASFRQRYALDPAVTVAGPWRGNLNPAGTTVRLLPPGASGGFGALEALPVDAEAIEVAPVSPWPLAAFRSGMSLVRRGASGFAGDGASWIAARPTPGESDEDFDGLPDAWESEHGLSSASGLGVHGAEGDPDGDGYSNAAERLNQTDPRDRAGNPRLRAFMAAPGKVACLISASPGAQYVLEGAGSDDPTRWETLRIVTISPDGTGVTRIDMQAEGGFLLRLRNP